MIHKHSIRLVGPGANGPRISANTLRHLLDVLTDGVRGAVRLRVDGRSTVKGKLPEWLLKASDFAIDGRFEEGSTIIPLIAPSLSDVVPSQFAQPDLFEEIDVSKSCLTLFEDGLEDAISGNEESGFFDSGLLSIFDKFTKVLGPGIDGFEIRNGQREIRVEAEALKRVKQLERKIPKPRQVKVAGKLDAMRHHDMFFALQLDKGKTIRGIAEDIPPEKLKPLWGEEVVVSGTAVFRPSGTVLRLEAGAIEPANPSSIELWGREPKPLGSTMAVAALRQTQGPRSGLNAIIGKWPGEESDDDIFAALEELR